MQVRVDFANGMSISFHNNWITPPDFEGPVNQGHEIVGANGKVESDQQYRGLRWWRLGGGSRTANNHFTRNVKRPDGSAAYVGYGIDSLTAGLAAICRMKFFGASRSSVAEHVPDGGGRPDRSGYSPCRAPGARLEFQVSAAKAKVRPSLRVLARMGSPSWTPMGRGSGINFAGFTGGRSNAEQKTLGWRGSRDHILDMTAMAERVLVA